MTSLLGLVLSLVVLFLTIHGACMQWWLVRTERRLRELERLLRVQPLTPSEFREPEPGSYILSDAEAAQVEAALLAESRGRALSREARGWRGFKSS